MFKQKLKNKKGLTLIELLAVIVILGIIAAIAVPAIMDAVNDSKAKSFSEELNTIETLAQSYETRATIIDYTKIGTVSGTGLTQKVAFDRNKVTSAFESKQIPINNSLVYGENTTHLTVHLSVDATGKVTGKTGPTAPGTKAIPDTLAEQLGNVYLSGANNSVSFRAYPIDVELLYEAGLISDALRFPTDKSTVSGGYGSKYQNISIRNHLAAITFPTFNDTTKDLKAGHFFITDNGRVFYTGTDANAENGKRIVHMAGSFSK